MIIGIPKEIKNQEYRISMMPSGVQALTQAGHRVLVETEAAQALGIDDESYCNAGAEICPTGESIFAAADLIVKVKEPQIEEIAYLKPNQLLFTYLHLAANLPLTERLLDRHVTSIAYETITDSYGRLPLLAPMSEIAGILGAGQVGANAARMAMGLRAQVIVMDTNVQVLRQLDQEFQGRVSLQVLHEDDLNRELVLADLVIGSVLIPGAAAPKLIRRHHLALMKPGAVIVDVAIDQGGCCETSEPTTHDQPTYIVDRIVHYCVANMPGAVANTATRSLTNATLPYIQALADHGLEALRHNAGFAHGLNTYQGHIVHPAVAAAHQFPCHPWPAGS
jgi:alanine dehydrogenase